MTETSQKPLTWRERLLCELVIPIAVFGAIWDHFKEHWEGRDLRIRPGHTSEVDYKKSKLTPTHRHI